MRIAETRPGNDEDSRRATAIAALIRAAKTWPVEVIETLPAAVQRRLLLARTLPAARRAAS